MSPEPFLDTQGNTEKTNTKQNTLEDASRRVILGGVAELFRYSWFFADWCYVFWTGPGQCDVFVWHIFRKKKKTSKDPSFFDQPSDSLPNLNFWWLSPYSGSVSLGYRPLKTVCGFTSHPSIGTHAMVKICITHRHTHTIYIYIYMHITIHIILYYIILYYIII